MASISFITVVAFLSLLAVLGLVAYAKKNPQALLLGFLLYNVISVNASVFFLDSNSVYISETGTFSHNILAGFHLLVFHLAMTVGVAVSCSLLRKYTKLSPQNQIKRPSRYAVLLSLMVICVAFLAQAANIALSNGVPFPGSGYSRQGFWNGGLGLPVVRDTLGVLMFFVPVICAATYIYGIKFSQRYVTLFSKFLLVSYFAFLIITGQVFHGLALPALVVAAIVAMLRVEGRAAIVNKNVIKFGLLAAIALAIIVPASFKFRGLSGQIGSVSDAIIYRILALQGSTYWQSDLVWQKSGVVGDLADLLDGGAFLINALMPSSLAQSYLSGGVNLQGALPGTLLLTSGLFGAIFGSFLYGFLFASVSALLIYLIREGMLLLIFPASYVWLWVGTGYTRASLEEMVSLKFLLFLLLIVLGLLLPRRAAKNSGVVERLGSSDARAASGEGAVHQI